MVSSRWDSRGGIPPERLRKRNVTDQRQSPLSKDSVLSQNVYGRLGKRDKIYVKFWGGTEERCSEGHLPDW